MAARVWIVITALVSTCAGCTGKETSATTARVPPLPGSSGETIGPAASGSPAPSAASASAAPPGTVRFVGRFDRSDPNGARFAWSGSAVVARFRGTALRARLRDDGNNFFQVIVDGAPKSVLRTKPGIADGYTLVDGLPDGIHEVVLYKRTEAKVGEAVFLGFDPVGEMLTPQKAPERRIEIIGDSITTGYGNEGPGAACTFRPDQQNEYATYGAIAARALDADHHTIAWSGKTIKEMTDFYDRTLPTRNESHWDFAAWVPQLVILNVGTNNFAIQDPGEERWLRVYTALVTRVRKAYPDALIVCALGPMLTDIYPEGHHNLTIARKYMKSTMTKLKNEMGETKVELLEFPEQKHSDGLGCGFHPSIKTQTLMADRVVALAKEKLGW